MASSSLPASGDAPSAGWKSLRGTLPLLGLTAFLFVGAVAVYLVYPQMGPYHFPIWGLLLTLAFVAAIGSTVSWFWAVDEEPVEVTSAAVSRTTGGGREEMGRPAPEIGGREDSVPGRTVAGGRAAVAPWDEDVLPPVVPKGPRPVLTTPEDPGDIGRALEEIAEIQRQLVARPKGPASTAEAPARA